MNDFKTRIGQLMATIANGDELPDADPDGNGCPKCDGHGHIINENVARPCECVTEDLYQGKLRELKNKFGINFPYWPPPFIAEIENKKGFISTSISDACRNFFDAWVENDHIFQCLILTGNHGRGKTLFPMSLLREFLHAGKIAIAVHYPWLVGIVKQGIYGNSTYRNVVKIISKSDYVFIDEPGWEQIKSGEVVDPLSQNTMVDIVQICDRQRNLIISTNLTLEQLGKGGYLTTHSRDRLRSWAGKQGCIVDDGDSLRDSGIKF